MTPAQQIVAASATLMLLTFGVGLLMLVRRVREMKANRIKAQSVALSAQRAALLKDSRAADNYNHLLELPVIFYALCALALATGYIPAWLPASAWAFVALRILHSAIQTTVNRVLYRFVTFLAGFFLLALTCTFWAGSFLAN